MIMLMIIKSLKSSHGVALLESSFDFLLLQIIKLSNVMVLFYKKCEKVQGGGTVLPSLFFVCDYVGKVFRSF